MKPAKGQIRNHGELRELMRWFAFELSPVPSCLRPILWRYVWEGRKRHPARLVPEGHGPRTQVMFSRGNDHVSIDGRRMPYAAIVFDPFLAKPEDICEAMDNIRRAFGVQLKRGRSPLKVRAIKTAATYLGIYLDYFAHPGDTYVTNLRRTQEAWEKYRASADKTVGENLWMTIKAWVEPLLGDTVSESLIRRTLKGTGRLLRRRSDGAPPAAHNYPSIVRKSLDTNQL